MGRFHYYFIITWYLGHVNYDLSERTFKFSVSITELCKNASKDFFTVSTIQQLFRSATSIGANYAEANGASSLKDFRNKIHLCKKECLETNYWLRLLDKIDTSSERSPIQKALQEVDELSRIFSTIAKNSKR
jgi:four helix bundle protein